MGSTRRRFTEEYKAQAVAFVIDDRRSIAEVARKKAKESGDSADKPLGDSERAELAVAGGERRVEDAGRVGKKVVTWFAKDKQ